jgi:enterochelin esterase-like enzyme
MPTHPLLAMARTLGNPVISGDVVTFIWQGTTAPRLMDDLHNWEEAPQKLSRAGSELWSVSFPLPADAYLEYAFLDAKTGERVSDPLNPNRIWNGINAYNHFFYMPQARPTTLIRPMKGIIRGTVTRHSVPTRDLAVGNKRTVFLYRPPVQVPVPLVFVYDGSDYLRRAKLDVIVDNLIAEKRICPFAMALVQNGSSARSVEYSCAESTLGLLMECILPLARQKLNLEPVESGNYGIVGASLGGLMALFTAMRLPGVFRKVLSQSGAFLTPEYQSVVVDLVRHISPPNIDIWMDVGRLEWLLDGNRQMVNLLRERKYAVNYREYSGGHNYTAWRDDIWRGLETLYASEM